VDLLNSLALAAFIILVGEPRQLFEASFQLSFFVMLAISLMLPRLNELSDRWLRHDPLLPEELLSSRHRTWLWLARWFARYFALAFAAWIGSLPLSIKYFHLFSLISTPANLLAVPLGTAALMANLGALVTGSWLPVFTVLFNHAAWGFMVAMSWVSVEAAKIPPGLIFTSRKLGGSPFPFITLPSSCCSAAGSNRRRSNYSRPLSSRRLPPFISSGWKPPTPKPA